MNYTHNTTRRAKSISFLFPVLSAVALTAWCAPSGSENGTLHPVINGQDAPPKKFVWYVTLYYNGEFYCGGTLLNSRTVLSAAHCFFDSRKYVLFS